MCCTNVRQVGVAKEGETEREREGEREGRRAAKNLLIQVIKLIRDHKHAQTRDRTNGQSVDI